MPEQHQGTGAAGPGTPDPGASGPSGGPSGGPDFLDRLLARHVPGPVPGVPREPVVQARPRLAGPFERVDALPVAEAEGTYADEVFGRPQATAERGAVPRPGVVREVRTEHERTVARTGRDPEPSVRERETVREREAAPLLRPSATVRPPLLPSSRETAGGRATEAAPDSPYAPSGPLLAAPAGSPSPATGPLGAGRPDTDTAAAARTAARTARRSSKSAERTVHVQIGRLEVSAGSGRAATEQRREDPGRRPASLGLEEFLQRGGEGRRG